MQTTLVRFTVPERCKLCGALRTVAPETTISGGTVHLKWCCRACSGEWPMTRREQDLVERRDGPSDRRRITSEDRRDR